MRPDTQNTKITVGRPNVITPEMERVLFAYYTAGASVRVIHMKYGKEMGFSYASLINARDFYMWEQRCNAIRNLVMNSNTVAILDKYSNYMGFLDDLISDAMIRFSDNMEKGKNNSPFENYPEECWGATEDIIRRAWTRHLSDIGELYSTFPDADDGT